MIYADVTNYEGSDLISKMESPDPILVIVDPSCASHQIQLNGTCVGKYLINFFNSFVSECSSLISGCRACKQTKDKNFLNYESAPIIECQTCDQGAYLLTFDDQK